MNGSDAAIRLLEHNLMDVCELLEATLSLDGSEVRFVRRRAGEREEWTGRIGDWLVQDAGSWRIVDDAEFGAALAEKSRTSSAPSSPRTAPTRDILAS